MARTSTKWLLGCGLGCGVLILLVIGVGALGFFQVRSLVRGFEESQQDLEALQERHGRMEDFTPEPDGGIPARRLEVFLEARRALGPARRTMEESLALLGDAETGKLEWTPGTVFRAIGAGMGLLPGMAEYHSRRSRALLEAGMGMGEYVYLYTVLYYSWLGHAPADGPPFLLVSDDHHEDPDDLTEAEIRERRDRLYRRRLNHNLLPMLRRQLAAPGSEQMPDWRQALEAEIAAMEDDGQRLPWEDGLPEAVRSSLEPLRAELEATYSPLCNPLEVGLLRE
jgi:hypothetical protein